MTRFLQKLRLAPATASEPVLVGLLVLLALLVVSRGPTSMSGGAPHYLAISHSLVYDLDLDLTNQYSESDSTYVFRPESGGTHLVAGRDGGLYPVRDLGLPLLLTPGLAVLDFIVWTIPEPALRAARWSRANALRDLLSMLMLLLYGLTATLALRTTQRLASDESGARFGWWATLVAFATPPLLPLSILMFPEVPVALLAVAFQLESLRSRPRLWLQLSLIAAFPWMGLRYTLIAAVALAWLVLRNPRVFSKSKSELAIPLGSAALLLFSSWWMYGSWLPWARYADPVETRTFWLLMFHALGLLADPFFGLLMVAPFWLIAFAGVQETWGRRRGAAVFGLATFALLFASAALRQGWWGGYSPSARLLAPALPVLVPMLAVGLARLWHGWKRLLIVGTVGWATVLSGVLVYEPINLWSDAERGRSLLSPAFAGYPLAQSDAPRAWVLVRPPPVDPPLGLAVHRGNLKAVLRALTDGDDVDAATSTGETPLMAAASDARGGILRALLDGGADPALADLDGWTALMLAARNGNTDAVKQLLDAGADARAASLLGWTALMWAAQGGHRGIVDALLSAGAAVDQARADGTTALALAVQRAHEGVVASLLAAGADPRYRSTGPAPLDWASAADNRRLVRTLRAAARDEGAA